MLNKAIKKAKENKKGFTLAELLIVVAIIAVLVAISIPIFTSQLEKSREAVDAANIRAAYAEVMAAAITGDTAGMTKTVALKQEVAGWQNSFEFPANLKPTASAAQPTAKMTGVEIKYTPATDGTETDASISILLVKKTA